MKPTRKEILLEQLIVRQEEQIKIRREIDAKIGRIARALEEIAENTAVAVGDLAELVKLLTPPALPATIVFRPPSSQESS